jgi:hypothetical protein
VISKFFLPLILPRIARLVQTDIKGAANSMKLNISKTLVNTFTRKTNVLYEVYKIHVPCITCMYGHHQGPWSTALFKTAFS